LLTNGYSVLICGRDKSRIKDYLKKYRKASFAYVDLSNVFSATRVIKKSGAKVVITCAEEYWDLNALKACIEAEAHSIDLGSTVPMAKQQLAMNSELKKKNLIHITGCGSIPGIGNVMLRYAYDKFDKIYTIKFGFAWTSNIKKFVVPFSIQSIIEEFTMPALYFHNKKIEESPALSSIKTIYHRAIGKQKEFKIGHHPETYTFYNFCKSKGVKDIELYASFPDHSLNAITQMMELGFGSKKPVHYKGAEVVPVLFLTEVLKRLGYPKGYIETENLWDLIIGEKNGRKKEILMECIVPRLKGWEDAGCNIDTGMPASIIAQMIFKGIISKPGAFAAEDIVPPGPFFKDLRKRKMLVYENGKIIN
jgi:saccharopine dehydrogenase-like NADP-dependent oxidoreductase